MELNDLLALVRAGYTKSEISELCASPIVLSSAEPSGADPEPSAPAPVPVEEPAAPAAAPAQPAADNSEVLAALKDLTRTIQKNAILRDNLNVVKQDTAEDILGKIINPTGK